MKAFRKAANSFDPYVPDSFGPQGDNDPYNSDPYNQRFFQKQDEEAPTKAASAKSSKEASVKSHTAKNVEAQVKAAAPELTTLAKHRVALAYALACGTKTASTSTARRRMVEAFLTMPTFALQTLFDMHSAATEHTAAEGDLPPVDDKPAPEGEGAPAPEGGEGNLPPVEGEGAPAPEGGEGDLGGGMDMGLGGIGGGMGAPAAPEGAPETTALKSENEALVGDIQKLEQDVAQLQEVLPSGSALDLSSLLSEEALEGREEQLPAGEGEDPALNFMPEGEGEGEAKTASFGPEDSEEGFEVALLHSLQGVDKGEQASDPALPEEEVPILTQVDVDEPDFVDLPENILSDLAPAAGAQGGGPAAPKAANVKKASAGTGSRALPSGAMAPASSDDTQVQRLANLLNFNL